MLQTIDDITFKIKKEFDFSFLHRYGKVFKVFDDQDSGNICFGVDDGSRKLFIKFAGAEPAEYEGAPCDAVKRLRDTIPLYRDIASSYLIKYIGSEEVAGGLALIFTWAEGKCMARMYPEGHCSIMGLPTEDKLSVFADIIAFMKDIHRQGYHAVDFYDGSIMYDADTGRTTICDIDFFRKKPCINDMGRMWGSERFLSPEEYTLGSVLDEVTNVFTLGKMGFSLFTDSDEDESVFPLDKAHYDVLKKASSADRADRYPSIEAFEAAWNSGRTVS
ncbi:MAG: serine/threonine protein kinase [Oscillospiraceae bacterium]|nr:serine/threonine protein kinase [Oscillospiraceae bacterium]